MEDASNASENPRRRYWNFLTEEKTSQTFLLLSLILGATWSFTETFIFIHLETVGFTRQDLGQSLVFSTFIGILMSICSSRFLTKFGWQAGISLALVSYSLRLIGYTWIGQNNYTLLALLESLKPLGNPLMMLTTGFFMQHFIQIQDIAIFQSLFGSAYFGLAKGMGSIAGGLAIGYCGSFTTFQVLALLCFAAACLNFIAPRLSDKKKEKLQQL
ncbi:uncharacterized protein LOC111703915 [Eurytemora carolleeae]|uniref:uncharacterized protein LOC111703915 n=1 Tax=Eurytemora carolleeae TaxID=1294199 RepID=UPI000C766311|nr:uncharacterized protein LOC111703915 [Eurytemora carolleeae]|eukprot:XP_023331769.1 uncharacterized protein LOC111703915 [Eurytemora affinis]